MTIAVLLGPIVWSAVWCLLGRWDAQCSLCDRPCDLFRSPVGDDDGVYDDGDDGDDDNDGVYDDGDGDDGDVYMMIIMMTLPFTLSNILQLWNVPVT